MVDLNLLQRSNTEGNVPPAVRSSARLEPPLASAACTEQPGDPAGYCVASQRWRALRLAPTYDFAVHGREIELPSVHILRRIASWITDSTSSGQPTIQRPPLDRPEVLSVYQSPIPADPLHQHIGLPPRQTSCWPAESAARCVTASRAASGVDHRRPPGASAAITADHCGCLRDDRPRGHRCLLTLTGGAVHSFGFDSTGWRALWLDVLSRPANGSVGWRHVE